MAVGLNFARVVAGKKKLTLTLALLSMPLLAALFFSLAAFQKSRWLASCRVDLDDLAAAIIHHSHDVGEPLAVLASHPSLARLLAAPETERGEPRSEVEALFELTKELLAHHDSDILYLMDAVGTAVACGEYAPGKTLRGENYRFRPYFTGAIAGWPQTYTALGVTTGKRGLYYSVPVYADGGGQPVGVLAHKLGLGPIDQLLAGQPWPAVIVTSEGVVFAANRSGFMLRLAWPLTPDRRRELIESRQFADSPLEPLPFRLDGETVILDGVEHTVFSHDSGLAGLRLVMLRHMELPYPSAIFLLLAAGLLFSMFSAGFGLAAYLDWRKMADQIRDQNDKLVEGYNRLAGEIAAKEESLRENQEQRQFLASIIESLSFPFYVIDPADYRVLLANRIAAPQGLSPGVTCHRLTHRSDQPCGSLNCACPLEEVKRTGKAVQVEHVHFGANGDDRVVSVHAYPVFGADGEGGPVERVIEVALDITELRWAERALSENELRLRTIFESVQAGILVIDARTRRILDANPAAARMTGNAREALVGQVCHRFVCPRQEHDCPILDHGQSVDNAERTLLRADGGKITVLKTVTPIILDGAELLIESFIDISRLKAAEQELHEHQENLEELVEERTAELARANEELSHEVEERRRIEIEIQRTLREKETLLKEVHHRVKNNMQVISSLIRLQSRKIDDPAVRAALAESQNRIRVMALLHEKIYRSRDLSSVSAREYLHDLARSLMTGLRSEAARVALNVDIEPGLTLPAEIAIPCGLIVGELVTNALKYAFPDGIGTITIAMHRQPEGGISLAVADSGVGLPETFDISKTESLGLQLVHMMVVDQLKGRMLIEREGGTGFMIFFEGGGYGKGADSGGGG